MKRLFPILISMALVFSVFNIGDAKAAKHAGATLTQRGGAAVRFVRRQIVEANRKLRYTIKARYPQAVGGDARLVKLNQEIKRLTLKGIADFKKDFAAPEERMGTTGSSYESEYAIELATNDLVSITFYENTFYEGAAHGNHGSLTFNYDLNSGRELKLADLFKPNSNYLKAISDYAIKSLKKELGPESDSEWIETGAGAKQENYKSWAITRRGLKVTFDPYQVASYAEGPHEVVVPFSVLKNVIDSDSPLTRITGRK